MSTFIDIGVKIDLEDLIESRMLIQANSGGGKSGIARVMMEESYGKVPYIVLDKKGEYYTIKEKCPDVIIIGGRNADIQLSIQAAPLLARFIVSHRLTVIIDMSSLESDDQRAIFLRDFLKGLMNLTEEYWTQYLIFLEEAHVFCGQQDMMVSGRYVKNLMSEGRKMGFCGILLTQRISKLHKDAAAECNNKFIGRTFLDLDIQRSASEMGLVGQDRFKLRELKPKHFWAFGTSIEPHHVHEVVIRDAQTKFPKAGAKIDLIVKKPTEKVKQALAKLNELPQEAKKELQTTEQLKAEIKRLSTALAKAQKESASWGEANHQRYQSEIKKLRDENSDLRIQIQTIKVVGSQVQKQFEAWFLKLESLDKSLLNGSANTQSVLQRPVIVSKPQPTVTKKPVFVSDSDIKLGGAERKIITFLAQFPDKAFSQVQIAVATGYTVGGGGFNNALGRLNTLGLICRGPKISVNVDAMHTIIEAVGEILPQQYGFDHFKDKLDKAPREIYEVLMSDPERTFTKEEIAELTPSRYSPDGGGFQNAIGRLATLELLVRPQKGYHQLNPELLELS